ncbi:hypothetical protein L6452_02004 [Arctium lappa]|uniref:Uncharacterized protein n=1 Tax=Arctium lappa TaxID=4217 RepID=A0ACB9FIN3_ARCLA|nr:hypothetical protein L6452_02004 [Arctium lappa]
MVNPTNRFGFCHLLPSIRAFPTSLFLYITLKPEPTYFLSSTVLLQNRRLPQISFLSQGLLFVHMLDEDVDGFLRRKE